MPPYRIIGLIIDPYKLNTIRSERMKALGFSGTANYTDIARIEDELSYAKEDHAPAPLPGTRCV